MLAHTIHQYRPVAVELAADESGRMTGMCVVKLQCDECGATVQREATAASAPRRRVTVTVAAANAAPRPATADEYAAALLAADSVPL